MRGQMLWQVPIKAPDCRGNIGACCIAQLLCHKGAVGIARSGTFERPRTRVTQPSPQAVRNAVWIVGINLAKDHDHLRQLWERMDPALALVLQPNLETVDMLRNDLAAR